MKQSHKKLERIVSDFNESFPVGTQVRLRKDTGWIDTAVRGEATILGGHSAVACFEGVSGAYSIEDGRVSPLEHVVQ